MVICYFFQVISLSNMYSECHENVCIGLDLVMERFLCEQRMRTDKTVPRGCSHAVWTMEEYDEFNCWQKVRKGKTSRSRYYKCDKALKVSTKETTATEIDAAGLLHQVQSDGWVLLSPKEQHEYEMWRDWIWRQLEQDE